MAGKLKVESEGVGEVGLRLIGLRYRSLEENQIYNKFTSERVQCSCPK